MKCLDSCRHFVFRHMLCILIVCLVQVFAFNVIASLGCAVCIRLLVCWAAARDLHCKCIYYLFLFSLMLKKMVNRHHLQMQQVYSNNISPAKVFRCLNFV